MKNLVKSIGYILVYFVVQFMINVVFMLTAVFTDGLSTEKGLMNYTTERLPLITLLGNLLMVAICVLYFKIRKRKVFTEVRAVKIPFGKYLLPVGMAFAFSFIWALVTYGMKFDNSIMIKIDADVKVNGSVLIVGQTCYDILRKRINDKANQKDKKPCL